MTFLPIVARELRIAARRRSTYLGRLGAAFVPIAIAGLWLPVLADQFSTSQGKLLFGVLSTLAFGSCLIAGARLTSDCLSAEKREGTIGLLFLTDLKGYDVVLGKLVSSSLNAFYGLLGIVPVLALALLLGGVTIAEVGRMALLFVGTLFFSLATGVFVSTLSRNDRRAMFATVCVILLVSAGPYGLAWGSGFSQWFTTGTNPTWILQWTDLLKPSPIFAFQIARGSYLGLTSIRDFYQSLLTTHLISWMFLAGASLIVPRVCRERPPGQAGMRWLTFRNRWSYGGPEKRRAFRARLLDRNAFYWLAARDRIKAYYVWFFVLALGVIWGWAGWMLQSFIFDWDISLPVLFLLFLFFKVWLASEVCTRLVEDRASGAFELLLSSPLDLKDMARGQALALWRQFGRPTAAILIIAGLLLHSALLSAHYDVAEHEVKFLFWSVAIMLVADLITLQWVGMWLAITRGQIHRATVAACSRILLLPTILFIVLFALMNLVQFANSGGTNQEYWTRGRACTVWLLVGLATDLFFGLRARWQFLHHFRQVATERFAPPAGLEPFLVLIRAFRRWVWPKAPVRTGRAPAGVHWGRWLIGIPAFTALLALFVFAFWKHSVGRQIEIRLAALAAAGEPITIASLQNAGGILEETNNAATYFRNAVPYLSQGIRMPRTANGTSHFDWPGPTAPLTLENNQAISELIARNRTALDLLHTGAKLTRSRYGISSFPGMVVQGRSAYFMPTVQPWQMLFPLRPAAEILCFEAVLESERGDIPRAIEAVQTLLGIAAAMAQEPYLAGQQLRLTFLQAAQRALERILNSHSLSLDQIDRLYAAFNQAETVTGPALADALAGERCLRIDEFHSSGRSASSFGTPAGGIEQALFGLVNFTESALGARSRRFLQSLDEMDGLIGRSRLVGVRDRELVAGSDRSLDPTLQRAQSRIPSLTGYWDEILREQVESIVRLRVTQTALAIGRFRIEKQGVLPENLDDLVPQFLPSLPADPFGPGSLHYQRLDKGYLIYSVGRDGEDNGGLAPPFSNLNFTNNKRGFDLPFRVER